MKKAFILAGLVLMLATGMVTAQTKQKTETDQTKTKIKPTTTIGDKAHNVIHPKQKRSHGWKYKNKDKNTDRKTKIEMDKKG